MEESLQDTDVAASRSNVQHRSNEKSDHVVQKSVRRYAESEPTLALDPFRALYDAAVVIGFRRGTFHRESSEAVIPDDHGCGTIEQGPFHRAPPCQFPRDAKRALC